MHCATCGRELDERTETVWTKIVGWEKRREGGGTNHVALRKSLHEFMCAGCMTLAQRHIPTGQESLL